MRFEVTNVLDTIEQRLTTDVTLAQAVVDVGQVVRIVGLDGGRPVNLLRLGMVVDALARHLGEGAVMVYPVAGRDLVADQDLTSKERMVLGRWTDDGLIESVPAVDDRVVEVADLTGLPVIGWGGFEAYTSAYPWLHHRPDRVLLVRPADGGARLAAPPTAGPTTPEGPGQALLARAWRCPRQYCSSFGSQRASGQPVPRMRAGVPSCPRHGEPLVDAGPRPAAVAMAALVDGVVRTRFALREGRTMVVGRAPDDPDAIGLGQWLAGPEAGSVSRNHLRLDLYDGTVYATDTSTNGTVLRSRSAPMTPAERIRLPAGRPTPIGTWDVVELQPGVEVGRAGHALTQFVGAPGSVMADAPTMALRPGMFDR